MLNRALGVAAAVAITYSRGSQSVSIAEADEAAWPDNTRFSSNQEGGARLIWGDRDYLIKVSALTAMGEPREGDRITETINGTAMIFQVMTPDTGEPSWRYSDTQRTLYQLHVKRVG